VFNIFSFFTKPEVPGLKQPGQYE